MNFRRIHTAKVNPSKTIVMIHTGIYPLAEIPVTASVSNYLYDCDSFRLARRAFVGAERLVFHLTKDAVGNPIFKGQAADSHNLYLCPDGTCKYLGVSNKTKTFSLWVKLHLGG